MSLNQKLNVSLLAAVMALGGIAGCGGSRNSSDPDAPRDYSLGAGDVNATWSSSSTELVHDKSRGALYYLDVENQDVVRVQVDTGAISAQVSLLFGPSKLRLTADNEELYILESETSASTADGFPDLIHYNIPGNYVNNGFIEIDSGLRVDDFVANNNQRVVVATYLTTQPSEAYLDLVTADGVILDQFSVNGTGYVTQKLALASDQQTLLASLVRNNGSALNTVNISTGDLNITSSLNLTLAQTVTNTYEPDGGRVFRSDGVVWESNQADKTLGSGYESIDFDLEDDRIVILVRGSSGFIIRYFDIDSLEVLSEQTLPDVADAVGKEPVKVFVDDDNLYVVYRDVSSAQSKEYLLVEFDYP